MRSVRLLICGVADNSRNKTGGMWMAQIWLMMSLTEQPTAAPNGLPQ